MIYMMTTALAIATAIGLGILFGIGKGMNVDTYLKINNKKLKIK